MIRTILVICFIIMSNDAAAERIAGFNIWSGYVAEFNKSVIVVDNVYPNSPADIAGIKIGDIITHLDGIPVSTKEDFFSINYGDSIILSGIFYDGSTTKVVRRADMNLHDVQQYLSSAFRYSCSGIENNQLSIIENFERPYSNICYIAYVAPSETGTFRSNNQYGDADVDIFVYKYGSPNFYHDAKFIARSNKSNTSNEVVEFGRGSSGWYQIIAYLYKGKGGVYLSYSTDIVTSNLEERKAETSNICRTASSFCRDFTLKSAACGFVGSIALDEASRRSLGADAGTLGGAASGVACTTMLSQLSEIDLTPGDLVASVIGGAAGSSAADDFSNGDIISGILKGTIALGAAAYSNFSCLETIKARC